MDPKERYEESIDEGDGVYCVRGVETLEEYQGSYDSRRCERDVVNGIDNVSRERVKRLIEVSHLNDDARHAGDREDIGTRMTKLVVSSKSQFEGDPQAFSSHHRYRSHQRADRNVNNRRSRTVAWSDIGDHDECEYGYRCAV